MTGWAAFALAMAAFLGSHFAPRIGGLREMLIARLGRRVYFSADGFLSPALLAWGIMAAGRAPHVELWPKRPGCAGWPTLSFP